MIPLAIVEQSTIPPKIFTRMAFTCQKTEEFSEALTAVSSKTFSAKV